MPNKREIEQAKKIVSDPGFRYAVAMHTFLNRMYYNASKEQRYALYEGAGIGEALENAERRARAVREEQQ